MSFRLVLEIGVGFGRVGAAVLLLCFGSSKKFSWESALICAVGCMLFSCVIEYSATVKSGQFAKMTKESAVSSLQKLCRHPFVKGRRRPPPHLKIAFLLGEEGGLVEEQLQPLLHIVVAQVLQGRRPDTLKTGTVHYLHPGHTTARTAQGPGGGKVLGDHLVTINMTNTNTIKTAISSSPFIQHPMFYNNGAELHSHEILEVHHRWKVKMYCVGYLILLNLGR